MPQGRSVLFVCTGNTCRSPLAEALCRVRLAERLGCKVKDLASRGYVIRSGGIAMTGLHAYLLGRVFPNVGPPPELLCGQDDLPDPIGGDAELYQACASLIVHHVDRLISEWLDP